MEKLKKCSKCGRELPVSEFWKNASNEDGLQTYCKECGNVYAKNRKKIFLMLLKWEYLKKENVYSLYVSGMIWESIS